MANQLAAQKADEVRATLMSRNVHEKLFQGLPKHVNAEGVVASVCSELVKNPSLMNCDLPSILGAIREAATCGWQVGGFLGHCYLVPFGKKATLIPGYKGLIDLCRRSGEVKQITMECVREKDKFYPETCNHERHRGENRGPVVAYYVIFHLTNGGRQAKSMTVEEVESHRDRFSPSHKKKDSPWNEHFETMAYKTIVKWMIARGLVPMSLERLDQKLMDRVVQEEDANEDHVIAETLAAIEDHSEEESTDPHEDVHKDVVEKIDEGELV